LLTGLSNDGLAQGMLASLFCCGSHTQHVSCVALQGDHIGDARLPDRERARLVKDGHPYPVERLNGRPVADQHAVLRTQTAANHQGSRRRQAQGAWARHDQHRNRSRQRQGQV